MQISFNEAVYQTPFRVVTRSCFSPYEPLLSVKRSYYYVRAVMPPTSAKPLGIYQHVCGSSWSMIGPLTFSDIYKILNNAALYVLMSVIAS